MSRGADQLCKKPACHLLHGASTHLSLQFFQLADGQALQPDGHDLGGFVFSCQYSQNPFLYSCLIALSLRKWTVFDQW